MCNFFFFQAEDGIRDATVTGVQTCALPISEMDELALAHGLRVVPPGVMEAVDTHLERAVAVHGMHLERPRYELPRHLAADVGLDGIEQAPPRAHQPVLVVIELEVVHEEPAELLQIASVEGVEDRTVEGRDRAKELVVRRRLSSRLGIESGDEQQGQEQQERSWGEGLPRQEIPPERWQCRSV